MQSTCRRTSAWRRTMTVAPVALVLSLAVLHPDCADDALEREHLAALVRQIELADRLANQLADQTAPYDAPRDAGLAQVDSGSGCLSHSQTRMLHGQTRYGVMSRFFDELPESALKWLTPKNQGFTPSAFGYGSGYASTRGGSGGYGGGGNSYGGSKDIFASPPMPPQKAAPSHGLRSGMQVFHNKFDEGMVLAPEGTGDDARAQVRFARHGVKWLVLSGWRCRWPSPRRFEIAAKPIANGIGRAPRRDQPGSAVHSGLTKAWGIRNVVHGHDCRPVHWGAVQINAGGADSRTRRRVRILADVRQEEKGRAAAHRG
ncbi:hypothetical protein Veis_4944 [Verminephrobacter eiseniae EF01-2]|uniref:Uncharacterized protein n=1 Tax=Verminephrobacter eiseniae (strain EF01-2) TaxID=391735 RepID=A1WSM4_VEREI|nr:hypothetical protein Veis_4944 [Verminephrobacter eiseniae EF01-2]